MGVIGNTKEFAIYWQWEPSQRSTRETRQSHMFKQTLWWICGERLDNWGTERDENASEVILKADKDLSK